MVVDQILRACADYVRAERELRAAIGEHLAKASRGGASWRAIAARVDLPLSTAYTRARPYLTEPAPTQGATSD